MKNYRALIPGLVLILIGGWFLAQNLGVLLPDIWNLWPGFIVLGGVSSLTKYFSQGRVNGAHLFNATLAILLGVFFFMFTLGVWQWEMMAQFWPLLLIIVGAAFFVQWLVEIRVTRRLILALVVGGIGVFFLPSTLGWLAPELASQIQRLWPIALIVAGIVVLFGGVLKQNQNL